MIPVSLHLIMCCHVVVMNVELERERGILCFFEKGVGLGLGRASFYDN